jgi:hypothetical protein
MGVCGERGGAGSWLTSRRLPNLDDKALTAAQPSDSGGQTQPTTTTMATHVQQRTYSLSHTACFAV